MKKLLLICLTVTTVFLQGCDERITPTNEQLGGGNTPITGNKTELLARKWVYQEINSDVDGKKTVVYGSNKTPNLKADFFIAPNDYFFLCSDGILESVNDATLLNILNTPICFWIGPHVFEDFSPLAHGWKVESDSTDLVKRSCGAASNR